ncbi:MAG: ABC transporter permease [Alphaproteobacteria bacterium]|nr:ABC transporter permease [Alphaproteobacteria bacterium]
MKTSSDPLVSASRPPPAERGVRAPRWRRLRRDPVTLAGLCAILLIALAAALAPWVTPFDPDDTNPEIALQPPSLSHPLGTDLYGRDQLSRVVAAARIDLLVPLCATAIAFAIGASVGAVGGYVGGWADQVVMRIVDAVMAFPAFVLAMGITAALGNTVANVVTAIAVTQLPGYLRLVRAEMLRVREMEYAEAARTVGNPTWRIVFVHLLPNCLPPVIVQASLAMGFALLTMAALSFIGLGIAPPASEWGAMTAEGADQMVSGEWWLFLFPGLAIVVTVLAFNLIGDGLRDMLDPRMRGVR